jgi:hypothetical protein
LTKPRDWGVTILDRSRDGECVGVVSVGEIGMQNRGGGREREGGRIMGVTGEGKGKATGGKGKGMGGGPGYGGRGKGQWKVGRGGGNRGEWGGLKVSGEGWGRRGEIRYGGCVRDCFLFYFF